MAAKIIGNAFKYEHLGDEFSPKEIQLLAHHDSIFNAPAADPCPICQREKSPNVPFKGGPCLYCIEDALRAHKPILLKHLPDRWPADAHLIQMAHELIQSHHQDAHEAAVAYIMKAKHAEKEGKIIFGTCAKQSAKAKLLHGWDYIIEMAWDIWAMFNDHQREAGLFHEIKHIKKAGTEWKLEPHSVEEHVQVIEIFGLWQPDLVAMAEVIRAAEEDPNQKQLFEG